MATEQQQQPAALRAPKELRVKQSSPAPGVSSTSGPSQPVEFRGFEFFSQREHNEYKDASRAYFAEKNGNPSSWLGDATPPASAHPSFDEPRPVLGSLSPPNENESRGNKRILGLQRPWFWTVLGILGVIVVVAIGVGVGVGVGAKRSTSSSKTESGVSPASDGTTGTSTPGMSALTTATSSSSSPAATRTSAANPDARTSCPAINGTVYQVPGSTKKFLQLCGVDYGTEDGAVDIRNVYTDTAQDCIDNCAGTTGCTGCGWGFIEGDKGPPFRCWLKDNVDGKSHAANATWYFAVLL
ncbi:hypothetical protein F4859DRAFT_457765 [Xylaria cf. heliscus]|nr:hypothetical protein F4859DRAFT_457765 [Xylaria cf. heliscus]